MKMRVRFQEEVAGVVCWVYVKTTAEEPWMLCGQLTFGHLAWGERYRLFRNAEFLNDSLPDSMPAINE